MKKIVLFLTTIIFLTITLSLCLVSCKDSEDDYEETPKELTYSIAVISDLHVIADSQVTRSDTADYISDASNNQRLLNVSEAILATTVDKLLENAPNVVLVAGDLTENGTVESIDAVSKQFKRLEDNGIQVFVTGGLSDFSGNGNVYVEDDVTIADTLPMADFPIKMARYGYRQALSSDEESLSYVADLPDSKYRLLVIDTLFNYDMKKAYNIWDKKRTKISAETLNYIEKSLHDAVDEGKEMIVMSYLPINEITDGFLYTMGHYYLDINGYEKIDALLTKYGVTKIFTGSTHYSHNVDYTDDNGTTTDYYIGSLTTYPIPVFYCNEYDNAQTETEIRYLEKVNVEYVPDTVDSATKNGVTTNLTEFSKNYLTSTLRQKFVGLLDRGGERNSLF